MLKVDNLCACYGESIVLNDVSLKVEPGKVTCLLGRNGVGKSTLLKSIMGLVKTPKGSVCLNNENIIKLPTYKRAQKGIGYVPQGRDIFPQLTVHENLILGMERNGHKKKSIEEEIFELFPVLKTMLDRKGGDLSGGQQQQLAIARALISEPEVLLLDEPTEGIQPSIIQEIGRVIKKLKNRGNVTMLIVEQYLEFVMDVADYFYVMDKGRIVMEGKTEGIDPHEIQEKIAI
ncbi:MAG TPA: urea ABC transporter ATP-binding subunit UrtE [Hungateiclostridium thermocellum]|uniref:Urea ABC transporter ATP-binding protein n=1 Tax=Acetivibrio thermocellus AD2 TaxID=1138384 RepID=A0AB36TIQ8_ACETH|nr:urea ABC transporter ATP-binding subunit UrtE [Acetivibrio thermocellus]ADU75504.1 urea ABC transporter, ATP-binding protein UrtE [Acetivibrio thermocellus DSM 1313]ALX09507.1 urea ABC transporter, ATP-binding protein UrtE [Acetivibrio thermocellus AD2]ANV77261.1 urea ABC transporter, ATP-binding protein UrtE [Acetivibrio thermocellus DSM 2360]EIC04631.1 urea ABC transporter, ATP-binding protein UrtE [Acetivibrio thermocellus YS]NLU26561.1 urea ABC transporter ATP-binding subunit UrtE [Acet